MTTKKTTTTHSTKKTATEIVDSIKDQPQKVTRTLSSDIIDKAATSLTKAQLDIDLLIFL